jgi:aminoglycoside 6'-N-acetyltransferase
VSPPNVRLRKATVTDIPMLEYWDTRPHVIACSGEDDSWDWPNDIARDADWEDILVGEIDGRPVGVIQIIDPAREESQYWGEMEPGYRAIDIWIGEESDLSKGYGTQIMQQALARCFDSPDVKAVLIDPLASNKDAIRFYERLGFKQVGPRRFGNDDCIVYRFDRSDMARLA